MLIETDLGMFATTLNDSTASRLSKVKTCLTPTTNMPLHLTPQIHHSPSPTDAPYPLHQLNVITSHTSMMSGAF